MRFYDGSSSLAAMCMNTILFRVQYKYAIMFRTDAYFHMQCLTLSNIFHGSVGVHYETFKRSDGLIFPGFLLFMFFVNYIIFFLIFTSCNFYQRFFHELNAVFQNW